MILSRSTLALLGGCMLFVSIGQNSIWGSLLPYFTNYFRFHGYTEITDHDLNIVSPLQTLGIFIGQNLSIPLSNKIGSRRAMLVGLLLYCSSLFTVSYAKDLTLFIFMYAGVFSMGIGILYMTPISVCVNYFPNHKGLVTGTVLGCYGFSGVIL
jgi:fucose permease